MSFNLKHPQAENKFKCPCHGSQYDSTGKKIRGPAPLVSTG
jgi:cytochrome b6-f complex iron-sulfur subunit